MIVSYFRKGQLIRDNTVKNLAQIYLKKARSNLITMEVLDKVSGHREILAIPKDHNTDEWIVVAGYYAMYMAALSLLAKIGLKSKSHAATSAAIEEHYVKKKLLEKDHLSKFEDLRLRKEEIELLRDVKDRREIAQYSVTKRTTRDIAEKTKKDAREFVDVIELIFDKMR